jgi:DNA modification methylase
VSVPYYQDDAVTIFHGRCEEVMQALNLSEVAMVVADPPYGVSAQKRGGEVGGMRKKGGNFNYPPTKFPSLIDGDDKPFAPPVELLSLLDHCPVVILGANHFCDALPRSSRWLVWDKRDGAEPNDFADAELAWTNLSGQVRVFRHFWSGMIRQSERGARLHPMQKPVALMKWAIGLAQLPPNSLILDPYTGCGPVLRAAKDLGHRAIGIDSLEWCCERAAERCKQAALPLGGVA